MNTGRSEGNIRGYEQWAQDRYGQGHEPQRSSYNAKDMQEAFRAGAIYGTFPPETEGPAYDAFVKDYWPKGEEWYRDPQRNVGGRDFRSFFMGGYLAALDLASGSFNEWLSKAIGEGLFSPDGNKEHAIIITAEDRRLLLRAYMGGIRRATEGRHQGYEAWRNHEATKNNFNALEGRLFAAEMDILESMLLQAFSHGEYHDCDASEELYQSEGQLADLANAILCNSPSTYDGDEAAEAIALRYVRDLEELRDSIVRGIPRAIFMVLGDPNFDADAFYRAVQVQRGQEPTGRAMYAGPGEEGDEGTEGVDGIPQG